MPEPLAASITDSGDYPPVGSPEASGKAAAVRRGETLAGPEADKLVEAEGKPQTEAQADDAPPRQR